MQVTWALDDDDDDDVGGGAGQWSGHGSDDSGDVTFPKSFQHFVPNVCDQLQYEFIWFRLIE